MRLFSALLAPCLDDSGICLYPKVFPCIFLEFLTIQVWNWGLINLSSYFALYKRYISNFIVLWVGIQFTQHLLLNKLSDFFSFSVYFDTFVKCWIFITGWVYFCIFYFILLVYIFFFMSCTMWSLSLWLCIIIWGEELCLLWFLSSLFWCFHCNVFYFFTFQQ